MKDGKEEERESKDECLRVKKIRNIWSRKMWKYVWSWRRRRM